MRLNELTLSNFKNITETRLELSGKVNCFLGNNGMGKSNLLDAVYFLSFCKSFSGINDRLLISRGEDWAIIKGLYERKGMDEELVMGLSSAKRKSIKRGGKEYQRLSMHIGAFPLVMVAPQDIYVAAARSVGVGWIWSYLRAIRSISMPSFATTRGSNSATVCSVTDVSTLPSMGLWR